MSAPAKSEHPKALESDFRRGPLIASSPVGGGPVADQGADARWWLLPALAVALVTLFLLAPGAVNEKARLLLHGLCAQRPSHSFQLGGVTLPFDARMTGIYGGFALTSLWLAFRGRFRAGRAPSTPVLAVLVAFVAALAFDGVNSTLLDLRQPFLYQPENGARLITGLLTGETLAVVLCYLTTTTLWRRPDRGARTVSSMRELAVMTGLLLPLGLLIANGPGWLYLPLVLLLICGAVGAVTLLLLASIVLIRCQDRTYRDLAQARTPAAVSMVAAVVVIVLMAAGRVALEQALGVPPLP